MSNNRNRLEKTCKKVIIDSDIGIDDAQAITYLSSCRNVKIIAVTLVAGNASMGITSKNGLKVLSYLGQKVPVYLSGSYNLSGNYIETDGYCGKFGFADIDLPVQKFSPKTDMSSAQALIHYARKYPKEITFVFIGPLSNLALAFIQDNEILSFMGSIIIMGSDRSEKTLFQPNKYAEFNTLCDPIAFSIFGKCFQKISCPVSIFDWTACRTNLLPVETVEKIHDFLKSHKKPNPHLKLFSLLSDKNNKHLAKNFWDTKFLICDLYAAIYVNNPEIVTEKKRVMIKQVDITGEKYGHVEYENDHNGFIELVMQINTNLASKILLETFCTIRDR